ncbi:MAG: sigma 54-interacting transcriptional regulator [Gammaproteobacteria bacterium]
MDEKTILLCSGNREQLLLDLDALGYRVRVLPAAPEVFEAMSNASAVAAADGTNRRGASLRHRYCLTRSLERALQEALAHRRPVLVSGETGTGKEVFARALAERSSTPTDFPVIHCQALQWAITEGCCNAYLDERLDAALRNRPALLLLDEVGDLGQECQRAAIELLAAVDQSCTRIVVTSNRSIEVLLEHGDLLPDFVAKLDLAHIHLPPLRDQPGEIPILLEWFVAEANGEFGMSVQGLAPSAVRQAVSHTWPGNLREMRNAVFRSVLHQPNGWIEKLPIEQPEDLPLTLGSLIRRSLPAGTEAQTLMQQFERELLQALHELHGGNKSRIARALRVSRNTLKNRLRAHNLR